LNFIVNIDYLPDFIEHLQVKASLLVSLTRQVVLDLAFFSRDKVFNLFLCLGGEVIFKALLGVVDRIRPLNISKQFCIVTFKGVDVVLLLLRLALKETQKAHQFFIYFLDLTQLIYFALDQLRKRRHLMLGNFVEVNSYRTLSLQYVGEEVGDNLADLDCALHPVRN
jgi:hypothetical protein